MMPDARSSSLATQLTRIAQALERLSPPPAAIPDLSRQDSLIWFNRQLIATTAERLPLNLLCGLEHHSKILLENTRNFAIGLPANNALLWGARGTGKSSLLKAIHQEVNRSQPQKHTLPLIEIPRSELPELPQLLQILGEQKHRAILFCDDLAFSARDAHSDASSKALKSLLEGSLFSRPRQCLIYATSNRRHIFARQAIAIAQSESLHAQEEQEEAISLSDRFGLWLGFHPCSQDAYLNIIDNYLKVFDITPPKNWKEQARAWATARASRSGRIAWQFLIQIAAQQGHELKLPPLKPPR